MEGHPVMREAEMEIVRTLRDTPRLRIGFIH